MRNVSSAPNLHIRMVSEGSCDTEDYYILKYIKIKKRILFVIIFPSITEFKVFFL